MLDALQQQLLATLATACPIPLSTNLPISTRDMWNLLTALVEESLMQAAAAPGAVWLDWQFAVDTGDCHCYEMDAQAAGTYQLVGQTNCTDISLEIDGRTVTLPFTVRAGERLTLTIERATPGSAAAQFLRISTYRHLVAS